MLLLFVKKGVVVDGPSRYVGSLGRARVDIRQPVMAKCIRFCREAQNDELWGYRCGRPVVGVVFGTGFLAVADR